MRCRKTVSDKGRRAFQGRIEAYARFAEHARAFPAKRRIQRKNHSLQNAAGEISGTKTMNALTLTSALKTSQSGKRFSKTRSAHISTAQAY